MLRFVQDTLSDRKVRLFAVGCCRRGWAVMDEELRSAIHLAESVADEPFLLEQAKSCGERIWQRFMNLGPGKEDFADLVASVARANWKDKVYAVNIEQLVCNLEKVAKSGVDWFVKWPPLHEILRDIAGDPFANVDWNHAWLNEDVQKMAAKIYELRRFQEVPILADALEEAGCTDETILTHCREAKEHVRGCWVIDTILGKG
ncbi:MAG: hypothetical protein ACFCD0_03545 [Gemmataceae bacterium]